MPPTLSTSSSSSILHHIVKENRKLLQEHLKNVVAIADYLFEKGLFTRSDYHQIEDIENVVLRNEKFLDVLVSKHDDAVVVAEAFIQYLGSVTNFSILHEKLKMSYDKFNPMSLPGKLDTMSTTTIGSGLVDLDDFTLTPRSLEFVVRTELLKNEKGKQKWGVVISNMNGLDDVELLTYNNDGDENDYDNLSIKMRLRSKGEHQNVENYINCTHWTDIVVKCLTIWKERNGNHATFYSLVGIFQHSQLIQIADWLLENKVYIQQGSYR